MTEAQKKDFVLLCNNNLQDIKQYIKKTLVGEKNKNDYWCIMKTDKKFSTINLYIIKTETFYNFIEKSISISIKLKSNGTCLHLSEYIALQRKGGGNTDHAPNHTHSVTRLAATTTRCKNLIASLLATLGTLGALRIPIICVGLHFVWTFSVVLTRLFAGSDFPWVSQLLLEHFS